MPDDDLVVANTSPLLNLELIGRLDLLLDQFSAIVVPEQVWDELAFGQEGLDELRDAGFLTVEPVDEDDLYVEIAHELDAGETAAITYALHHGAGLVLLDEREGRRVAKRHGLAVTGVIGILLRGERDGSVDLEGGLDALREAGFWISEDLYADVLDAGEKTTD